MKGAGKMAQRLRTPVYFSRGLWFNSQHFHGSSQLSVRSVPANLTPSHAGRTLMHIKKNLQRGIIGKGRKEGKKDGMREGRKEGRKEGKLWSCKGGERREEEDVFMGRSPDLAEWLVFEEWAVLIGCHFMVWMDGACWRNLIVLGFLASASLKCAVTGTRECQPHHRVMCWEQ